MWLSVDLNLLLFLIILHVFISQFRFILLILRLIKLVSLWLPHLYLSVSCPWLQHSLVLFRIKFFILLFLLKPLSSAPLKPRCSSVVLVSIRTTAPSAAPISFLLFPHYSLRLNFDYLRNTFTLLLEKFLNKLWHIFVNLLEWLPRVFIILPVY